MQVRHLLKRVILMASLMIYLLSLANSVSAEIPYDGYHYDLSTDQMVVAAPNGYLPKKMVLASDYGLGSFSDPQDLFVSQNGELYIMDTGNNRVVILNKDLTLKKVVDTFVDANGKADALNNAKGIFVAGDGHMLIADYGNERVLITDENGMIRTVLKKPKTDLLDKEWIFNPTKVVEDTNGLIYVLADRLVEGALVFDKQGQFMGFFGSNTVETNVLQAFWKSILSSVQLSYMEQAVPVENANYFIDKKNFIYAVNTNAHSDNDIVRKFNPNGKNVLWSDIVYGDRFLAEKKKFVDITVDDEGFLYILDAAQGKVYMHNTDGKLLSVFGGQGQQMGTFVNPTALVQMGETILVLDGERGDITVFAPTGFIQDVREALQLFNDGRFLESLEPWEKVLQQDTNYYMANYGIGKAMYMQGDYPAAMSFYKRTHASTEEYSDAFKEYRRLCIQKYLFPALVGIAVVVAVLIIVRKVVRSKRGHTEQKSGGERIAAFPLTVMAHPFQAFTKLKYEGGGSIKSAAAVLLLFMVSCVALAGGKSYIHNEEYGALLNIPMILLSCLAAFILFTVANWSICTLTEGKGRFSEIFKCSAYALLPCTFASFLTVALSYCLTVEESAFLQLLMAAGILWSVSLLLIGLQTIHMYTMGKTLLSCLLTIVGMAVILFVAILFYSLLYQVYLFIQTIVDELRIRG